MILVYVAGPFRASNAWEIEKNIRRAEETALWVWRQGAAALCPHTNTRFFQGAAPDRLWLEGDLEMLRRCDAVLLVWGWERSEGTKAEIAEAQRLGIPVFAITSDLARWLRDDARPRSTHPRGSDAETADPLWPLLRERIQALMLPDEDKTRVYEARGCLPRVGLTEGAHQRSFFNSALRQVLAAMSELDRVPTPEGGGDAA